MVGKGVVIRPRSAGQFTAAGQDFAVRKSKAGIRQERCLSGKKSNAPARREESRRTKIQECHDPPTATNGAVIRPIAAPEGGSPSMFPRLLPTRH